MIGHLRSELAPNLLIDPMLREAAERAARKEHRSVTSLIEKVLTDHLRRTGYLSRQSGADEGLRPHELSSENDG
jgi:hypothetical protein